MSDLSIARIPTATYRVQFTRFFTFRDAKRIVPYLSEIGISDMYASPYFKARKGSLHGYDIVDHGTFNPEVGTDEEYDEFTEELWNHGMGQILDIVPNHMCITDPGNIWWMDVLENGPSSRYAGYFDIDWTPTREELRDRVLLPVLGDQYGTALENGELRVVFEEGSFSLRYYDHSFPLRPETYNDILKLKIEDLGAALGEMNPRYLELLSIMTALEHLPLYTEKSADRVNERAREKEVIKNRLEKLSEESPEIREHVERNVVRVNGQRGDPESFDMLDNLLGGQAYRLCYWRVASEEINYRRFFDINELAALRVEEPHVYAAANSLVFRLIRRGKVTGLRVDHPDGLYNPREYFQWLQRDCFLHTRLGHLDRVREDMPPGPLEDRGGRSPLSAPLKEVEAAILRQYEELIATDQRYKAFYIVGEKILTKGERMPEDWPIFSTTGYVFLNSLNGIFIDMGKARTLDATYARFVKATPEFSEVAYEKKKLIMQVAMAGEISALGRRLVKLAEKNRHTRDFTLNSLTNALTEIIAFFPVYRSYRSETGVDERDRRYIELAVTKAKRRNQAISESIFEFLKDVLLGDRDELVGEAERRERLAFVMRLQQLTGPVMAKGVEDTAFYVYNRFVSLNEVGGSPDRFGTPLETFHGQNIDRIKHWPHALITTSTHDTKRSEDVRARINVLSEIPDEWRASFSDWRRINKRKKVIIDGEAVPDRNEEYLLYQTLVGAWPLEPAGEAGHEEFRTRIRDYTLKAAREAKVNTSWINPNRMYEDALGLFIERILTPGQGNQFLKEFLPFQRNISAYGMYNSLSQTVLKIASPGVADFYQGTELWDYSLVDPDNRRPVDYEARMKVLEELKGEEERIGQRQLVGSLLTSMHTGKIKLYVMCKGLNHRRENRGLFESGEYLPLEVGGERKENVCAFARRSESARVVVVVPRFVTQLTGGPDVPPVGAEVWRDSCVIVPYAEPDVTYRNIFTDEFVTGEPHEGAHVLRLGEVFADAPVAIMERVSPV